MGRGRVDFERGIARLSSYARYHGHANPKADEVWLGWSVGLWVSSLRVKFRTGKLTDKQVAVAEEIGVRFTPPYRDPKPKPPSREERKVSAYLERLARLEPFYRRHGHINVPQADWHEKLARSRTMDRPHSLTVSARNTPTAHHRICRTDEYRLESGPRSAAIKDPRRQLRR